jgi:adenylate cyclase
MLLGIGLGISAHPAQLAGPHMTARLDFMRRRGRLHTALFISIGLIVSGFAVMAYGLNLFERVELTTVDKRFAIRGPQSAPTDVVVVGVDDVTFGDTGLRWPFPRSVQATVIDNLTAAGARVIAEDIQFTERTTPMPGCGPLCDDLANTEDGTLVESVYNANQKGSKVVLSTTEVDDDGSTNVLGGVARLTGSRPANGNYVPEVDGVIRRFPYQLEKLQTFPVVAAERALGHVLDPETFPGQSVWIDFVGPPGAVPFVSFSEVLSGKFDPALVRGKIVVIGVTAPSLQDVHPTTSGGGQMSGPEIQANAIHTVLHGFTLRTGPSWLNLLVICVLGLVPPLLGLRMSAVWTIASAAVLGGLYIVATQYFFNRGLILAVVYPVGALCVSTVGALGVHYVFAAFERQRARDTFARFVPAQVANQLLAQGNDDLLRGVRVVGTCMFVDLRGSTQFAESLPPETVVRVINRYLGELTGAIMGNGGSLISYLGDGFMAVFGAPVEQEDHADRAVAAAREMLGERLPRFNEWLAEQGYGDGFRIGVGLNSGPFMAGNVGSEQRMEYTAMGDTINTASRLEGSTKDAAFYLLIAESTRNALVSPVDDLVRVGEVDVRGRHGRIEVWSIDDARKPQVGAPALVPVAAPDVDSRAPLKIAASAGS